MSIVHISTLDNGGGADKVAHRLSLAQRNAGHDSKRIVGALRGDPPEHVFTFPLGADPRKQSACREKGLLYYELEGSHGLVDHPIVKSADIIHLHNTHGGYFNPFTLLLLSRVKPVVWTLHDMQAFTGHCAHAFNCLKWKQECGACRHLSIYPALEADATRILLNDKEKIYARSLFQLVTPSYWLNGKIKESILKKHPLEQIYNGVDTDIFKPHNRVEARRMFDLPEQALIVGGVADFGIQGNEFKGGRYALEAFKALCRKYPDSFFISAGKSGPSEDPHVIHFPRIEDERDLARFYSCMDIYFMTSMAENCPLVVLEAMACGVPIVGFSTGGVPELARNNREGFLVETGNQDELNRVLAKAAGSRTKLEQFSKQARRRIVHGFEHSLTARRYEIVYRCFMKKWAEEIGGLKSFNPDIIPEAVNTPQFQKYWNISTRADRRPSASTGELDNKETRQKPCLVSAVVSTYNSERFIRGCIEDLEDQTIADRLEIIVVNSHSSENEEAIVRELQDKYGNIKYIATNHRETVYGAWNRGIKGARGRYITNANTDDRHRRDAYELMAGVLDKRPDIALVYADVLKTRHENETFADHTPAGMFRWHDWDRTTLLRDGCFMGPQPMWRKSVHDYYGYFDSALVTSGDFEFWLRISQTHDFHHLKIPLGLYLERPDSIEHRKNAEKIAEDLKIQAMYLESMRDRTLIRFKPFEELNRAIDQNTGDREAVKKWIRLIDDKVERRRTGIPVNLLKKYNRLKTRLLDGGLDKPGVPGFMDAVNACLFHQSLDGISHPSGVGGCLEKPKTNGSPGTAYHRSKKDFKTNIADIEKKKDYRKGVMKMKTADELYKDIQPLLENEWHDAAVNAMEKLLEVYPDHAVTHNDLGVLYLNQGENEKALVHYEKAVEYQPENITFLKNLADFYYVKMEQVEQALGLYVRVLEQAPRDLETLMIAGHICVSLYKFEDAGTFYEMVLKHDPANVEARDNLNQLKNVEKQPKSDQTPDEVYQKVNGLLEKDMKSEALVELERLIEAHPDHAVAHNDLGVLYYEQGDKEKALLHYEQAVTLQPGSATFQKNLADFLFVDAGNVKKALEIYVGQMEKNPKDVETLMTTGHMCLALFRFDDAAVFYQKVIELEPWNEEARGHLDQMNQWVGEDIHEKGVEDIYKIALSRFSDDKALEAAAILKALLKKHPDFALAHNDLGVLYYNAGDMEEALTHYETAARLNPENITFQKNLADLYHMGFGRVEAALKIYVNILAAHPEDIETLMTTAYICLSLGKKEDAKVFFKRILEIDPEHSESSRNLESLGVS